MTALIRLTDEHKRELADAVDDFFLNRGASRDDFDEMLHARVERIVAAHVEAAERALVERCRSVLGNHYHADTCGSVLSPDSGYECTCWKRDLRAALAADDRTDER